MEHECWLFVNKQGPSSRQWKKRWVGWNENNQALEYRKQPGDRSVTVIGVGKVDSISASSVCHHRKNDTTQPSTGFIVAADRVYYFSCETIEERDKWIEFLWRKRSVYISLGSTESQHRPSLTGSGHDYSTQGLDQTNVGHILANMPPLMPVILNEAMATGAPKIQITPRSEGEAAPLSPHTSHRQAMEDESKRASWSPMSLHEIDLLKKEKDQLEIDLKSLRDKFDTVSQKYKQETNRLSVNNGSQRIKNTSESAPNTLKYKSTIRKSILPGANNPYEGTPNNNNTGNEDIPEEDEVEEGFIDLDKLINNENYDSPRGGSSSVPDTVAASPRESTSPRQAVSPNSILDRRRMHKGHSKSDEFNRTASVVNQRNGPEELKNIDFSKFGYYAKNKTAEEIVLDLLNENKTLKERKRKAENDLNLLQLKYNEDLRKIVEYDHIIEKLNDEKAKLRDQTNKLKTDRTNFEKEKEILGHNMNNINTNNAPNTIKSPRSGSVDRTVKSKEDGQKKMPKKQLLKDLETVTKQLEQLTQEYEAAKSQWQQEKKKFEEERNKTQPKERTEVPDNGSGSNLSSPDQPTNMNPEVFYKNKWLKLKERHEQDLRRTKSLEEERNKLKSDLAKLPRAGSTPSIELAPSLANAKLFRHPQLEQTPNLSQLLKEKLALNNELRQLRLQMNDINGKISHGTLEASDPQKIEIDASIQTKTARLEEVSKLIDEEDSKSNLNSANLAHKPKNSPKLNVPTEVRISIKTLTLVLVVIVAYVFKTL